MLGEARTLVDADRLLCFLTHISNHTSHSVATTKQLQLLRLSHSSFMLHLVKRTYLLYKGPRKSVYAPKTRYWRRGK